MSPYIVAALTGIWGIAIVTFIIIPMVIDRADRRAVRREWEQEMSRCTEALTYGTEARR